MYQNGEAALDRILELVAKCPKELQDKCFEVLLAGYVQLQVNAVKPQPQGGQPPKRDVPPRDESPIPPTALPRFNSMCTRLKVAPEKLETIFDFSVDPFALHAVNLPGKNDAEKTRQVALLAASRSYLAAGSRSADWQEVKSLCVDHNCYNSPNHVTNLKQWARKMFKGVEPGKPIQLSASGTKEAEKLLKKLAEETPE